MPSDAHIRNVMMFLFFSELNANQSYEHLKRFIMRGSPFEAPSTIAIWTSRMATIPRKMKTDRGAQGGWIWTWFGTMLRRIHVKPPPKCKPPLRLANHCDRSRLARLENFRWIPYVFTQRDVDRRVDAALSHLTLRRTHVWLNHLKTGDEKWILYSHAPVIRQRRQGRRGIKTRLACEEGDAVRLVERPWSRIFGAGG